MNLELSNKEKEILISALENFISELRAEIASGVKHDWRVEMKKEESGLKEILSKLQALK